MAKFRKKPVVIEAIQYDGTRECAELLIKTYGEVSAFFDMSGPDPEFLRVKTLEGVVYARKGDWIIKGVKGEIYPCKPDIFAATYEAVEWDRP